MKICRFISLLCAVLLLAGALGACAGLSAKPASSSSSSSAASSGESVPVDPNFPVTVGEVTIAEKPARVVSLNPALTELVNDLGLWPVLAGDSAYCLYPEKALDLTHCGSEIMPDVEAIAALKPQLALTLNALPSESAAAMQQAGVTVLQLSMPEEFEQLPQLYSDLARALLGEEDGTAAARALSEPLMAAHQAIRETCAAQEKKPLGAYMAILPLTMATDDSPQGWLLADCGIANGAAGDGAWQMAPEKLLPFDPEVMLIDRRMTTADDVRAHPNYKTTPCVKNEKLLEIDGSAVENGGKRLFEIMLSAARLAHPTADLPETLEALTGQAAPKQEPSTPDETDDADDTQTPEETSSR